MADNRIEVQFGAETGSLKAGAADAANAVQSAVQAMNAAFSQTGEQISAEMRKVGQDISKSLQDAAKPIPDSTKSLREGAKQTSEVMRDLKAELMGLLSLGLMAKVVRDSTQAYMQAEAAMYGLSSAARYTGNNFDEVMAAAQKLSADGLMSLTDASRGLQNLIMRGFGLGEAIKLMERFKDSASFNRQASLEFGQAVVSATEGLKNENSILVDNAGVTKNVSVMWKEFAAQHGKGVEQLTQAEKRQAEYNGILKETEGQVGNAAKMSGMFAGELARMNKAAFEAKAAFGQALTPVMGELYKAMLPLLNVVRDFIGGLQMTAVHIRGLYEKMKAVFDAGGLIGLLFSGDARGKVKERFEEVDAIIVARKEEIYRKLTAPIGFNPSMGDPSSGNTRKDSTMPNNGAGAAKTREAPSLLDDWRNELEQRRIAEQEFFKDSRQADLAFWEAKVELTAKGSKERLAVEHEIYQLRRSLAQGALATEITTLKAQEDAEEASSARKIEIADQIIKRMAETYGEDSKEYAAAVKDKERIAREHEKALAQLAEQRLTHEREINLLSIEMEKDRNNFLLQMGAISQTEAIERERQTEERIYQIKLQAAKDAAKIPGLSPADKVKADQAIEELESQHVRKMAQIEQKAIIESSAKWRTMFDTISSGFSSSIRGMIAGTMTFKGAMLNIASSVAGAFIDMGLKIATDWAKRLLFNQVMEKIADLSKITGNAAVAGAAGVASMAAAPWPINMTAPAFGAEMFAAALSYAAALPAAAAGYDIPAGVNPVTQLHQREMVLPAQYADVIRGLAGSPQGRGGSVSLKLKGVKDSDFVRAGDIKKLLKQLTRNYELTQRMA